MPISHPPESLDWPGLLAGNNCVRGRPTEDDWRTMFDAAKAHGMQGALAARLRALDGFAQLPARFAEQVQSAYRQAIIAALGKRVAIETALDALAAVGIVPVGYKGVALAYQVYPEPCMRTMSDIDLWLPEGRMSDAKSALSEAGFVFHPSRDARPDAWQEAHGGEVQMRHPHMGLVELHYDVFPGEWLNRMTSIDRRAVKSRLLDATVLDRPMRVLAPRDHLIQVVLHAAISNRHSIKGLRGLLDIALLADQVEDWDAMCEDIRRWRVRRVMAHAFHLAGVIFDRPRLRETAELLARERSIRWLDRHLNAAALLQRKRLDQSWRKWTYLLCAADDPADALKLATHALWPDAEWLRLRYGRSGVLQRVEHLANAMRGQV